MIYLDTHFHTAEKPEQGQVRLQHLTAIDAGFADAMNDKTERAQYEKAIEKLTALYKQYPEAEFIRPVIASLNVEMAEALIDLDKLEDAVEQFRDAYKANPLPQYRDRLVGLQADIKRLDPSKDIAEAQAAEKACQWDDAQADYAHALELRPSNKEARAGYTRILKFYAQVFLDNAQSKDGELTPQGAKFVKLAEKNGKQIAQYGDPELVLARAELILAESEFASDNQEKAKSDVDEALGSIAKEYRRTKDGAYLMARIFKLYYHLARYLNKQTEGRESLALADQYCRLALDQKNPKAAALFVQLQELERIEQQSSDAAKSAGETEPFAVNRAGDPRNLVNEGPLSKGAPLDSIAAQNAADRPPVGLPASPPGENSLDAPASKAPASGTSTAPENTTPATPTTPANSPAGDGLTKDQLLHPLH
ncbi:MAG: hypothetical protein ACREP2_12175 [Rhodanobacteraceae bacterium]